jgi:hypothetical protein
MSNSLMGAPALLKNNLAPALNEVSLATTGARPRVDSTKGPILVILPEERFSSSSTDTDKKLLEGTFNVQKPLFWGFGILFWLKTASCTHQVDALVSERALKRRPPSPDCFLKFAIYCALSPTGSNQGGNRRLLGEKKGKKNNQAGQAAAQGGLPGFGGINQGQAGGFSNSASTLPSVSTTPA